MTIDTARLRELAMKASPGPWHLEHCDDWMAMNMYAVVDDPNQDYDMAGMGKGCADHVIALTLYQADGPNGGGLATHPKYQENTEYLAALSPDVVIELLDELESLRAERQAAEDSAKPARPGKYPSHMSEAEKAITLQIPMGDKP